MDVSDDQRSSQLKEPLKLFKERLQEQTWQIQGIPGFVTMTHRDECPTCETYATHAIATARSPMVAILSHWIELAFWTAWPQVVTRIEDDAMDKAHSKLSWHQDQYEEVTKSIKLKLAFDFPVGMEGQLGGHAKTMLNKQLHFLDGLKCLSEGKHLQVKDCMEEMDGDKNYIIHSWLSLMHNVNYSTKKVHTQVVTLPLWKSITSQLKMSYLYEEGNNTSK